MRIKLLSATVVASLLAICLSASQLYSQGAAPRPAPGGIAVIDISYIFKNHIRFKQYMDQMRTEVQKAEDDLKADRDRIQAMIDEQKRFNAGSPEYKQRDEQILQGQADFNVRASKQKKEFLDREARIYYMVYEEINKMVDSYSGAYNVNIVLRYSSDPVDPADRQSVLKAINRPIVHLGPNMDITQTILNELNRNAPPVTTTGGNGTANSAAKGPVTIPRR